MRLTDAWQHMAVIILSFISLLHLLKQEFYENLILLSLTFPPENIYYHIHHHYSFQWHLCIRKNKSFIYALYILIFFFPVIFWLNKRLFKMISKPWLWNVPSGSRNRSGMKMSLKRGGKKKRSILQNRATKQEKTFCFESCFFHSTTSNTKTGGLGQG